MEILELLYKRRSIREYQERTVESKVLELLVRAAVCAPSACNSQPWEFVIVNDEEAMNQLRNGLFFGPYNAPAAIVVCANMDLAQKGPYKEYWIQDCSAATENIHIAAVGMGLGTVWIGAYPNMNVVKNIRTALGIPEHVIPLSVVYIGYAAEEKEARSQYDPKRVYWQHYDEERKHRAREKNLKHK